jgi:predicted NBD/HSP70 family sugar kinase
MVLGLSPTTAGQYVDDLMGEGYLQESGLEQGAKGRPKRRLSTCGGAGWFAGVEFNADRVQAVRVNFSGCQEVGVSRQVKAERSVHAVYGEVQECLRQLHDGARGPLLGIGVGAPGVVNPVTGVALDYAFVPGWKQVPLTAWLSAEFGVAVTVENNLRVIALAERWFGAGQELSDFVILGPRSGFGVAVVQGGQLARGAHFALGEVGRWPFVSQGRAVGELHDWLSAPAVWDRLSGGRPMVGDLRAAFADLNADWGGGCGWVVVRDYALVMTQLHWLLDADRYFLHGPMTGLGSGFCEQVTAAVLELSPALQGHVPVLQMSVLGDDAGALGAASLAMESWNLGGLVKVG